MHWWIVVFKVLITVFEPMTHILLNFYGLNDGKDLVLPAPTVQYMSSSLIFSFTVFLDWCKTVVSEIMAPRLKHERFSEIGSVTSNDSRTDSILFKWYSTLEKIPPLTKISQSNFEVKEIRSQFSTSYLVGLRTAMYGINTLYWTGIEVPSGKVIDCVLLLFRNIIFDVSWLSHHYFDIEWS